MKFLSTVSPVFQPISHYHSVLTFTGNTTYRYVLGAADYDQVRQDNMGSLGVGLNTHVKLEDKI